MRICILTRSDLFPTNHGAAVKIVRTAEHLSRQAGEPVFVVTDDRDAYLRFDGALVQRLPFPPRVRAAEEWPPLPRLGQLSESLCLRLGYPREELFLYRPLFDPAWWGRALAVGLIESIDVFQAEFPGYGIPAALAARALRAIRGDRSPARSAIVQHNVEWDRLADFGHDVRHIRRAERLALSLVDEVIAVSTDDRARMSRAGIAADRITVIPHGVDAERFATARGAGIRQRHGIAEDAPLLFFHGTLHYWPNTEAVRFIAEQLLPRLLPRHPGLKVLIAGQSPPRYYDHEAIVFSGPVDDLAEHIQAADLCLCPIEAGGGTRMKLLEYMAAGKAVVSTTKGAEGIAYTAGQELEIADGVEAFSTAVLGLLESPRRRGALGEQARRFARRYDWASIARAYLDLYRGQGRGADWNHRLPASQPAPVLAALPRPDGSILELRQPSKPLTLLLLINRGCNLRCSFCDLWDRPERISLDRLLPILDDAVAIGTKTLVITGGEPFLHRELFRVVKEARRRGLGVNITTNGTLIDRRWDELIRSGIDSLSLSVDGLEPTHDRLRGRAGAWKETMAALGRVLEQGIPASVYFTVNRENVGELVPVWEQVRSMGAGFDFWPVNDAPALYLQGEEDRLRWLAAVDRIAAGDPQVAARRSYYERALGYHAGELGSVRCLGFIDQYGIKYTGELIPCCVWGGDGLAVGNVFETPLRELWKSPAVASARHRLLHQGCTVGCFNHSLYEFSTATGEPFELGRPAAAAR